MPDNATDVLAKLETAGAAASLRSNEIEDLGRLPSDIAESLIDSGVFRLWIPTKLGGYQANIQTGLQAIERASYYDGAAGWCVMIGCTTSLRSGYLAEPFATEIYGNPRAVTGGFGRPSGTGVVTADGGLRVSGQWPWGSGSSHCTWLGGGVNVVDENGEASALPDGGQAPFVWFRRDEVDLVDNWHVAGLKGSGSADYVVDNVVIPEGRWISMTGNAPAVDGPLYRFSHLGALAVGIASVSLGLAARAVDELIALGTKMPDASSRTLAERAPVQADLAQADVNVRAARAFVAETVAGCWAAAEVGEIGDEHRRLLRLAANNAVERSTAAVDLCYRAAGGTAVYRTSPLQRIFRDAHVATQHVMTAPRMMEPLGRMLFGLPTSTAQF